jgi:hypothetical protein
MGSNMRDSIVTPTYATWDDVPCNASLTPGDVLPDGSTILFGTRMTEANATSYNISTDTPQAPNTAKDMSNMHKFQDGDVLEGSQAKDNEWYKTYKKDLDTVPDDSTYSERKVYIDTFKPIVDQFKKKE